MGFADDVADVLQRWAVGDGLRQVTEIGLSAAIIYVIAMLITRTGKKRFLGRNTVFDFLLALILGSVLSRAINGDATIGSTALAGFVLVAMHWLFGSLAERSDRLGRVVKGRAEAVMQDGRPLADKMDDHHITQRDIEEAARQEGLTSLDDVEAAFFERNGQLSIIPKDRVRVVEVDVQQGVQRVRVEIVQ